MIDSGLDVGFTRLSNGFVLLRVSRIGPLFGLAMSVSGYPFLLWPLI